MWIPILYKHKKKIIIAAIVLAGVIAFVFWKRKSDSQKAIGDLKVNKDNLTITPNQAIIIAENILGAMNQYGTNEQVIIDNLKTLKHDDIILVMKEFGMRPYNGWGLATRGYEVKFLAQDLNMVGWLREELDGDYLAQVENIFINAKIPF